MLNSSWKKKYEPYRSPEIPLSQSFVSSGFIAIPNMCQRFATLHQLIWMQTLLSLNYSSNIVYQTINRINECLEIVYCVEWTVGPKLTPTFKAFKIIFFNYRIFTQNSNEVLWRWSLKDRVHYNFKNLVWHYVRPTQGLVGHDRTRIMNPIHAPYFATADSNSLL